MMKEAKQKTVTTKKKGEKFAWRTEAINRLCEECYQVSQRLLFGPISTFVFVPEGNY